MALSKQARMLNPDQIVMVENFLSTRQDPLRETCIFYLSVYAGLRACEIAGLDWSMLVDAAGNLSETIAVTNRVAKGHRGGRHIPYHPKLLAVVRQLRASYNIPPRKGPVITARTGASVSPHYITKLVKGWYVSCGLEGCSSHSGRRTMITNLARSISLHGGNLSFRVITVPTSAKRGFRWRPNQPILSISRT